MKMKIREFFRWINSVNEVETEEEKERNERQ